MDKRGSIYLCKPGGIPLGLLNVEEDTVKLKKSLTNIWELSFDINEMLNGEKNPWYDQITERMELLLVDNMLNEKYRFIINTQPTKAISASDVKSILTVSANGIECDLQVKYLKRFKVNCGTTDSQEYLVYEENEDGSVNTKRNLNAYSVNPGMTNSRLAIDYIQLDCRLDKICKNYIQKLDGISEDDMEYSPIAGTYIIKNDSKYYDILKNLVADVPRIQKHLSYDKDDVEILTCYVYTSDKNISIDSIEKLKEGLNLLYKYYSKYKNKLSLFKLALENAQEGTWDVGEISDEFAATKWNFEIDDGDIYSFLTNTFANYAKAIISFDRYGKTISAKRIEEYNTSEYDTGVRIDMKNLVNEVKVDSNLQEGIKTKLYVGNDTLGIENAHFTDYIMNMDYYMNAQTTDGEYQYVDDNIHDAYFKWKDYCYNTPYKAEISVESNELRNSTYESLKSLYGQDSVEIIGDLITVSYLNRQNAYKELSKLYNQSIIDSDEIQYLLPTDYATIDFTTYQYDELVMSWLAYANAISSLETMYKSDYGYNQIYWRTILPEEYPYNMNDVSKLKDNMEDGCVPIEDTIYFGDWYAYKYSIMPQVYESLKRWVNTEDVVDSDNNILYSYLLDKNNERIILSKISSWGKNFDTDDFNKADPANLKFLKCEDDYLKTINDWVYQWELYGRDEIQSKFNAWNEASKLIFNDSFIKYDGENYLSPLLLYFYYDNNGVIQWDIAEVDGREYFTTVEVKQHKPYVTEYSDLNEKEKTVFGENVKEAGFTSTGWHEVFRKWTDYWGYTSRDSDSRNQMTNRYEGFAGLGVCIQSQVMLAIRNKEMDDINTVGDIYNSLRKNIQEECSYSTYKGFNSKHREVINQLIATTSYTNDNITGTYTNLDNIATQVDIQQNLYEDAVNKLSELSQPQYSFSVTMENLFALELYSPMWEQVKVGNFIYLDTNLYNSKFKKLRVISIESNPIINTSELTLEFSSMTKSLNGFSDLAFILENIAQGSTGSSSGSGGTSSSGGTYGENEADIQFSNNVLNALLMNNSVKTAAANAIIDTIQSDDGSFKKLFASSGAFDSLNVGETVISGDCVTTGSIKSTNYSLSTDNNGNTTQTGSILNLDDGTFRYADGNLTYENNMLTITGDINAENMILNNGLVVGDADDVNKPFIEITRDGKLICRGSDIETEKLVLQKDMTLGNTTSGKLFSLLANGELTLLGANITCNNFSSPITTSLQTTTNDLTTKVNSLTTRVNDLVSENTTLSNKISELEKDIEDLKSDNETLKTQAEDFEKRIKALEG